MRRGGPDDDPMSIDCCDGTVPRDTAEMVGPERPDGAPFGFTHDGQRKQMLRLSFDRSEHRSESNACAPECKGGDHVHDRPSRGSGRRVNPATASGTAPARSDGALRTTALVRRAVPTG